MDGMEMKAQRTEMGLTQTQLANVLGYRARERISEFETGSSPIPPYIALVMEALATGWRPASWPHENEPADEAGQVGGIKKGELNGKA